MGIRHVALTIVIVASALALAGCSSSTSSASGGSGTGAGTSGGAPASGATFSGTESGTIAINSCANEPNYSAFVTVKGSSDKLPAVIGSTHMDFVGTDSIYNLDKSGPAPSISGDGKTIKLDGVKLKSVITPSNEVTFAGTLTCP
jgi:hypothetical protein